MPTIRTKATAIPNIRFMRVPSLDRAPSKARRCCSPESAGVRLSRQTRGCARESRHGHRSQCRRPRRDFPRTPGRDHPGPLRAWRSCCRMPRRIRARQMARIDTSWVLSSAIGTMPSESARTPARAHPSACGTSSNDRSLRAGPARKHGIGLARRDIRLRRSRFDAWLLRSGATIFQTASIDVQVVTHHNLALVVLLDLAQVLLVRYGAAVRPTSRGVIDDEQAGLRLVRDLAELRR